MDQQKISAAWRAQGRRLAELRKAAGYTQHTFAPLTLYGRSTIANVETGHQQTDRSFWARCDELLRAGGTLVAGYDDVVALEQGYRRQKTLATAATLPVAPALASVPGLSDQLPSPQTSYARWSTTERRQAILAGIAAVAAASGLLDRPCGVAGYRVGAADVSRLRAVSALYRSVDYECGGGALYAEVARFAEAACELLNGSYTQALRPSLLAAVGEARQLAGWTAFDAGRHTDAQRHWLAAERAAVAADDSRLAGRVRYCQARQFQHLRHNQDALETLRLARDHLRSGSTPAITAMLAGAEAASLAALGQHAAALACLAAATEAFDQVDPDREPDWMGFFDRGELLAQYGRTYRDFARHDPHHGRAAVHWVTEAIAVLGPQNVRSTVLNQIGLCSALFLAGEPDEALTVGATVIEQAQQLTSIRIFDRIHNLGRDLTRYSARRDVRHFRHALTAIGPGTA